MYVKLNNFLELTLMNETFFVSSLCLPRFTMGLPSTCCLLQMVLMTMHAADIHAHVHDDDDA